MRVGISPPLDGARNPVANADEVTVRPGRSVSVQVLANDSDPDGSPLTVTTAEPNTADTTASHRGRRDRHDHAAEGAGRLLGDLHDPERVRRHESELRLRQGRCRRAAGLPGRPGHGAGGQRRARPRHRSTSPCSTTCSSPTATSSELGRRARAGLRVVGAGAAEQAHPGDDRRQEPDHPVLGVAPRRRHHPLATRSSGCPATTTRCRSSTARRRLCRSRARDTLRIDLNDYVVALGGNRVRLDRHQHRCGPPTPTAPTSSSTSSPWTTPRPTSTSGRPRSRSKSPTARRPTDPNGHTAILTLPIDVQPRDNQPPAFNGGTVNFEPGEEKELDLVRLTNYPYDDDLDELVYSVLAAAARPASRYELNGQRLVLRADDDAPSRASTTSIGLTVSRRDQRRSRRQASCCRSCRRPGRWPSRSPTAPSPSAGRPRRSTC